MSDATFTNGWVEDFGGAVLRVGFGPHAIRGDYLNVSNIVNGFVYVGGIHVGLATRPAPDFDLVITFNSNAYEDTVQRLMRALYFVHVEGEPFPGTRNLNVVFSNAHAISEATIPIYVVPVNDPPSAYNHINVRLGLPGTGDFFIAGTNGSARVILDASNSRDPDSSVLRYEWTVTNPKARTVFSSTNVIATVELRPRVYMTGLRVSDGEFDSDALFPIEVITAPTAVRRLLRHVRAELPARTERQLASLLTGATAAYARKQYDSAHLYLESFINRVQQTPTIPEVLRDGWSDAARMIIEETE